MNSHASNFSAEDINYMNPNKTMDSINSNATFESTELNIDTNSFVDMILSFLRIENDTNNSVYNEKFGLEEFDKVLSKYEIEYDKYDRYNDDLNYIILDLDNFEYITYKNNKNTGSNSPSDTLSDIQYFLYEHNYSMRKNATSTCEETLDTSKLEDSDKTEENSFSPIPYLGLDIVGELYESQKFCCTEYNIQEVIVESVNLEMINNLSTDNLSIYTISDDEQGNDNMEVPELDVISISSESSIEDRFDVINEADSNSCGYHSSDFEFIEEHEAKKNGLVIKNYNPQTIQDDKVKAIDIAKEYNSQLILDYFNIPADNNIEYKIPEDTNYINMFERSIPYPVHCMENKSIYTNNCSMNAKYQDLGFNTSFYSRGKVDKHIQDEAHESENKILFMYPSENRRLRKRRRT